MRKINRATPQTLDKAIDNAMEDFEEDPSFKVGRLKYFLKLHIGDFIRNNLGVISLKGDDAVNEAVKKIVAKL